MNGNNELRHPKIDEARRLLPMPELMKQLGLSAHVNTHANARCPLCGNDHTFALRENSDGTWWWRCESGCGEGDEITFLEKHLKLAGFSGAVRYLQMAGVVDGAAKPKQALTHAAQHGNGATNTGDTAPPQPTPLGELLDAVVGILRRFVVFPLQEQATAIALWVVHTCVLDAFDYTPYLHVHSAEKRSGKSRLLEVLNLLVRKPRFTPGGSSAALFRSIDENDPPTILLDEVDAVYSKKNDSEAESLRQFLNAGFKRGAKFLRCVGQGSDQKPKEFPAFCSKVLAGIGKCLPDTVQDRSLPIELKRQSREERAERFREREAKHVIEPMRAELEALAQQPGLIDALRQARPVLPDQLNDRQQDITEPLLAIADHAGGEWPDKGRAALVRLCVQEEDASIEVKLLADIKSIYEARGTDKLPTMDVLDGLVAIEDDRPFAQWWEDALKYGKPKGPAARLAKMLKRHKIRPCKIRLDDETVQGYRRADFLDAWERYLPACVQKNGTNGTDGIKPQFTRGNVCSDFNATTRNVPTSASKDGTRIHEGKTTNIPSVLSVPSFPEGKQGGANATTNADPDDDDGFDL